MFSSSKNGIEASVVENALVVSFASLKEPRVWRIDMAQFLSAGLEIRDDQGQFHLVIRPGTRPAEDIGVFDTRKEALAAMEQVTKAFLRGQCLSAVPKKSGGFLKGFLKFVLILFLLAVAAVFLLARTHKVNVGEPVPPPAGMYAPSSATESVVPPGVPGPADRVLSNPQD